MIDDVGGCSRRHGMVGTIRGHVTARAQSINLSSFPSNDGQKNYIVFVRLLVHIEFGVRPFWREDPKGFRMF